MESIGINPWLGFGLSALIIIFSGARLSRYGDVISEKSGLSKAWIGLILLASVTSLPELISGISSVAVADSPDIAVGSVLGSCSFNLLILSILDAFLKPKPLSALVKRGHIITGSFATVMLVIVAMSIIYAGELPSFGWVGSGSVFLFLIYLYALRLIYQHEKRDTEELPVPETRLKTRVKKETEENLSLQQAVYGFFFNSVIVIIGALFLPVFAGQIAAQTGMEASFVGTFLVAVVTSLPEMVVSFSSLARGSVDLAVGNLLGSNIFNLFILAVSDLFYSKGVLLEKSSSTQLLSVFGVILMTSVVAIGLTFRPQRKRIVLASDSLIILLIYMALLFTLYRVG